MRSTSAALLMALCLVCGAACAGASTSPPATDGAADTSVAPGADAAADVSTGTCPAALDPTVMAPSCNTVVNSAPAVPFTQGTGSPPLPAGGTVRDGLYEATRAEGFGGATPSGRRLTLVVLGGATKFFFAGDVLDAAGMQVMQSFRVNAAASVSGTSVAFATPVSCMSTVSSPLPPALDFTATADTLVMTLASSAATSVTTYTRRGCP